MRVHTGPVQPLFGFQNMFFMFQRLLPYKKHHRRQQQEAGYGQHQV